MTEPQEVIVARIDERLGAVERDVKEIKAGQARAEHLARPSWPSITSAVVAASALIITLIQII